MPGVRDDALDAPGLIEDLDHRRLGAGLEGGHEIAMRGRRTAGSRCRCERDGRQGEADEGESHSGKDMRRRAPSKTTLRPGSRPAPCVRRGCERYERLSARRMLVTLEVPVLADAVQVAAGDDVVPGRA